MAAKTPKKATQDNSKKNLSGLLARVRELEEELAALAECNEADAESLSALEESREVYADLYDFAPAGFSAISCHGIVKSINMMGLELLETKRELLLGNPFQAVLARDGIQKWVSFLRRARRDGRAEVILKTAPKHGTPKYLHFYASAEVRPSFAPEPALRLAFIDVTKQQLAEAALQEADRKKDEFLAMLAHELRNPMAAISASATLISSAKATDEQKGMAAEILKRRVKHLSRLIDDLLDVSRIARGKIVLRKEGCDFAAIVDAAVLSTNYLFEERKQTLTVERPQKTLVVHGDPVRLEQIVSNLLTNAAKYTPAGGTTNVRLTAEEGQALLVIQDNGIGMKPETVPHIFEMFGQEDSSFERSAGGLGVGLTIVKRLLDLHEGSIKAESDGLDKGSTFTVRLPLAADSVAEISAEQPSERGPSMKLLIVEDQVDTANATASVLSDEGHSVAVAHDGETAVKLALEERFDAVVLDLGLPKKSGFEVAREIRSEGQNDVLIIAVSGYGQERDLQMSREAGINHHLLKPLDYSALKGLLRNAAAAGLAPHEAQPA